MFFFFFICHGTHLVLTVLTHSSPTRRSSVLRRHRLDAAGRPRRTCLHPFRARHHRGAWPHQCGGSSQTRRPVAAAGKSEEHTSELQSLMRNSYAVFCLKKKTTEQQNTSTINTEYSSQVVNTSTHIHKK